MDTLPIVLIAALGLALTISLGYNYAAARRYTRLSSTTRRRGAQLIAETLKQANEVEVATGFTVGQIFGRSIGLPNKALTTVEVAEAARARAILERALRREGVGGLRRRPGPDFFADFDVDGNAPLSGITTDRLYEDHANGDSWTDQGIKFKKQGGATTAEFEWGPGDVIPTCLPKEVQDMLRGLQSQADMLRGLQAQADSARRPGVDGQDVPDAEDLEAMKVEAGSADPLAEPPAPRKTRRTPPVNGGATTD